MTQTEAIKKIIWGDDTPSYTDAEIINLVNRFGYNGAIRFIATSMVTQLSRQPTSVNDGVNSFGFNNLISGLELIIKMAERYEFQDPINENNSKKSYTFDSVPNKLKDYWGK